MANSKRWVILDESRSKNHELRIDKLISLLLKNRGLHTREEKEAFLSPDLLTVTPKNVGLDLSQLKKAVKRILQAVEKREQIIVYGDYDVDGITGSAILWETLHSLGANVMPYIPHRIEEGYGLSKIGLDNVIAKYKDVKLVITVDNGIVAHHAVDYANQHAIDVIITDHHMAQGSGHGDPDAYAIVHTTALCGAGVAYLLSKELKKDTGDDIHLELAALGTIADMVPLTGANRTIVYHGLKKMFTTKRHGLLALFEEAGIDHTRGITASHVGYTIAPRLNASGRLESGMDSLRLLCTRDKKRAKDLAFTLGQINSERQMLMKNASFRAIENLKKLTIKNLLISVSEDYQEGVIGLVAGKIVEEYYRPAIVIAKREKHSKASVRSVKGFNIIEFLRSHSDYFVNVGGHPMAAGFTIETEKIEIFQKTLETAAQTAISSELLIRTIMIDAEISLNIVTPELYSALLKLEPYGMGNPEPVFLSKNVSVEDYRIIGKEGKHLKLRVKDDTSSEVFDAIAFGMGDRSREIQENKPIDIVYTIDENEWNGKKKLQLKLKDFTSDQIV